MSRRDGVRTAKSGAANFSGRIDNGKSSKDPTVDMVSVESCCIKLKASILKS